MASFDYVIIGSGINALVAAATLGKKGHKVLVLERNSTAGGCLLTEEMTDPGFVHDVMATTMVLFLTSPAYAHLADDLAARGLEFAHCPTPTGVLRPDGSHIIFTKTRSSNVDRFDAHADGDGAAFAEAMAEMERDAPLVFSLLGGRLWSAATAKTIAREVFRRGPRGLASFIGKALSPARGYLETAYSSPTTQALWAPWVLHCGLNPESAYSAQMLKVIAFAIEQAGCPIVKGGARNLVAAFERLIRDMGGEIRTGSDVVSILAGTGRKAAGVSLRNGTRVFARRGVIASTTPNALYGDLLKDWPEAQAPEIVKELKSYRYGKGNMQMHYALSRPPVWKSGEALANVALLHLSDGIDAVSRACNEAERGLLPAEPTICVGQPVSFDSTRAPEGKAILWLQMPEMPRHVKGDAAGEIELLPEDGWTPDLREAYADRVHAILSRHIDNFDEIVLARKTYSPSDLNALNINLLGGDPYGGSSVLDQFFLWRPFKSSINHRTRIAKLYHIGASTHPGPGLGGGSGFLLASGLR
ncbi:phytoene desaturase family protein [Limoniibacter endophyticus]|uniref:FAD-dependent oxidoreductase n=1 Tax=Limoniibacter endophyticus TaxID=1565040 RepID=A0A8J3DHI1_9HYPH|nr:NAD(P)/FAD-dependent oxidoreductase [Limoniibacter endophyticus]GHC72196.1 FAD-dependent oxidoreductase [Limoniibacter endophyticus]